jgi:hypothetical protein
MADLEKQVDAQLEKQQRSLAGKPYIEEVTDKVEKSHFEHLVLYQIRGMSFTQAAKFVEREINPTHEDASLKKCDTAAITWGIKDAARRLVGDDFRAWLRPATLGRPRGPR